MNVDASKDTAAGALAPFLRPAATPSLDAFQVLCEAAEVLEEKKPNNEPKVLLLNPPNDGPFIIKVWHPDRVFTSARLFPYSSRFRRHAAALLSQGFNAPEVSGWGRLQGTRACYVSYRALPGKSLRELKPQVELAGVARFIARLHDSGIDFRSLHLGNILWQGGDSYALIDLTDCSFRRRPLPLKLRTKRLVYLCTHRRDLAFMTEAQRWADLMLAYSEAVDIDPLVLLNSARRHERWRALSESADRLAIEDLFAGR